MLGAIGPLEKHRYLLLDARYEKVRCAVRGRSALARIHGGPLPARAARRRSYHKRRA